MCISVPLKRHDVDGLAGNRAGVDDKSHRASGQWKLLRIPSLENFIILDPSKVFFMKAQALRIELRLENARISAFWRRERKAVHLDGASDQVAGAGNQRRPSLLKFFSSFFISAFVRCSKRPDADANGVWRTACNHLASRRMWL